MGKRILFFSAFVGAVMLSLSGCAQKEMSPDQTINGRYALDDGTGLSDKFLDFNEGKVSRYETASAPTFAEGCYWNISESSFSLTGSSVYSFTDGFLDAGNIWQGPASLRDGALYLGNTKYSKLDNFVADKHYSSINAGKSLVFLPYSSATSEVAVEIVRPIKSGVLSAGTKDSWITDCRVDDGKLKFRVLETEADRSGFITLSYTNAADVIIQVSQSKRPEFVFELYEPWVRLVWLRAVGEEGAVRRGFRYRVFSEPGQPEKPWNEVENVNVDGGTFEACQDELQPSTKYEVCAYCGESEIVEQFTTGSEDQIPNGGFETYSNAESKLYYSFYNPDSAKWWDSYNKFSTDVIPEYFVCSPDKEKFKEGQNSARLNSRYAAFKFVAGSVFSGEYVDFFGIGYKVNLGRPWRERPRHVTFSLIYSSDKINRMDKDVPGVKKGDPDKARVFVALGDWTAEQYGGTKDCPVQINTNNTTTFFKPDGPNVIAYAEYIATEGNKDWIDVDLTLDYRDLRRKPTHIIISCMSSMYGDYFAGFDKSVLWVDNFKLVY